METGAYKKSIVSDEAFTCIRCDVTYHKNFQSTEIQTCKLCKRKEVVPMHQSRVFVINHIGKDMSDAKQYGMLIPITEGNVNVFNLERLLYTLKDVLQLHLFDPKNDYILLSGGLPLNFIMGAICGKFGRVWLLLWDAKNKKYVKKEFKI